jgi:hypothetical protein
MPGLERRPFWPSLDHPFSNPIEKSSLEELVQILWICIEMYRKPWPSRAPVPISSSLVIPTTASSAEESHSCMQRLLETKFLKKPYMTSLLNMKQSLAQQHIRLMQSNP